MSLENSGYRDVVFLHGFDLNGNQVVEQQLSWETYYDGSSPLIDSREHRRGLKIRRVIGIIFGEDGVVSQRFENQYDEWGQYKHGKSVFADDTVQED